MKSLSLDILNNFTDLLTYNCAPKKTYLELSKEGFEELKSIGLNLDKENNDLGFNMGDYSTDLLSKDNKWELPEFYFNGYHFIIKIKP